MNEEQAWLIKRYTVLAKAKGESLEEFLKRDPDAYRTLSDAATVHVGPRIAKTEDRFIWKSEDIELEKE